MRNRKLNWCGLMEKKLERMEANIFINAGAGGI